MSRIERQGPEIGDHVRVQTWGGEVVVGIVDNVEADIKNGRPGIDYHVADGGTFWCYLDQIVKGCNCAYTPDGEHEPGCPR